ncbi:hypothetical protein EON83_07025 [bacterium]|nr:MAG: hypothetical protein EON83_07025 [bacterium]
MNEHSVDFNRTKMEEWFDRQTQLLTQLSPSEDYDAVVDYFGHFTRDVPAIMEMLLDGHGYGFESSSCRLPIVSVDEDSVSSPKRAHFSFATFGDHQSESHGELFMPFSEFLLWLRAQARLWSEIFPSDQAALIHMFHERDLAYLESEVGPNFDNGATWWRKIEGQRRTTIEACRINIASPLWRHASDYFCWLSDTRFPTWLCNLVEGANLPSHSTLQAQQLPKGGLRLSTPSWGTHLGQYLELSRSELESTLSDLVEGFIVRRPHRAEEVRDLLRQIKSRS